MTSKVQGEGDYESARRYDEETKRFVEEKTQGGKPLKGSVTPTRHLSTRSRDIPGWLTGS